ncbi:MAG TPA: molybdopterin biosynthesis protein [Candidatus Methanoculleus thermohydrogenotrophicum]|mgnify:CR=1 FL=1|jgi:putative molybdopterin biosynthesis protein|nr:molybdopterin biosynthesis protein [Candidatus Methanoculleus thermohydrogenotrophicum]NLM81601.1 molybdopterin biosynthesis protein [Candidatus Methanoculleus thermohydrogenotrophicum]HOB17106.1 molybdopterin biosynthesis protein [Candidatus Methanoculleus thermohydrogenotrophicum]HPZ37186.1 molybdopterin biosynthesis protein [Candidatus Methanoculleus thermohydrogenotrophicum]HQC90599.1 molybdopterin biosynthesis protein [Candidatus Methanoculleus thermohydrogenotrophicum]
MVKRYLSVISLAEALALVENSFQTVPGVVRVPVTTEAVGRITAAPIFARFSVPPIHISAMDGIAVRSADTIGASEQNPVTLPDAARVNTGNIVPPGYDAVVMIEDVWVDGETYTIRKPVSPWQHIRPVGEDIGESEMILPSYRQIRPLDLGALATYGVTEIAVFNVRVGLLPTGSELVPAGVMPPPGKVVESNTLMAAAILAGAGAEAHRYPIVPDDYDQIRDAVRRGTAENDIMLVSAGSSAGTRDYTADVIRDLGEVLAHGVAIKPGKPVIIGRIENKPVIGLPGYPLAAATVLREIVLPLLTRYGLPAREPERVRARLTTTLQSDIGTDEFVLLSVGKIGSRWVAVPQSRGAGVQMSAVRANGYMQIPAQREGAEAGETIDVRLSVPRAEAERAVLITGSHDPALDYLADLVRLRGVDLHSTHLGSMGGVIALKKEECHAAPMHLLAPDGTYNTYYLERYMPGADLVLLCVAERQQGVISRDGLGLDDLPGRRFINRQRGSGTRMLLDHCLTKRGIDPASIPGYEREVTTHLAVALAVRTGEADAGMGVYSAAKALGLSFVPVATERYELVMHRAILDDPRIAALVGIVSSEAFKQVLRDLGGYVTDETGVLRELRG